jgi:hypothetical protein
MTERRGKAPHPLDGCDEDKCYEIMMAERSVLITARRESEDNLIKTIIQISSALIAVIAGFASQSDFSLTGCQISLFIFLILSLCLAIIAGLAEQFFSSKAYQEQQKMLEDYFGKDIDNFSEAPSNKRVRSAQVSAFVFFVMSLGVLGIFAVVEVTGNSDAQQPAASATPTSAASATTAR